MDLRTMPTRWLTLVFLLPAFLPGCDTMPYKQAATTSTLGKETELPPPAELAYTVTVVKQGKAANGSGHMRWEANGASYVVRGDLRAGNTLAVQFKSEGALGRFGLTPDRYWERRSGGSDQTVKFDWQRKLLTFSGDPMLHPVRGTELDRGSAIMQLAAIARKHPNHLVPGAGVVLLVAGSRSLSEWRFKVLEQDDVPFAEKKTRAWHFVKNFGDDDNTEKVEVWLSPEHEWYPVKLRFEQKPGEYMTLLLSGITPLPRHIAVDYPKH